MSRLVSSLVCLAFAATLHASVPSSRGVNSQTAPANLQVAPSHARPALPLTAVPADRRSFFAEFYPSQPVPAKVQRKSGLLRRFTTALKKTAQKVNFFD